MTWKEGENTTNAHVPVWPLYLCFGQASNHSVPARPVSAIGVPQLTALARTLKRKTWGALYPPGDSSWGGGVGISRAPRCRVYVSAAWSQVDGEQVRTEKKQARALSHEVGGILPR